MTLEQRLKDIEKKCSLCGSRVAVDDLLQVLRKAIEQRNHYIECVAVQLSNTLEDETNKELLEILEGK